MIIIILRVEGAIEGAERAIGRDGAKTGQRRRRGRDETGRDEGRERERGTHASSLRRGSVAWEGGGGESWGKGKAAPPLRKISCRQQRSAKKDEPSEDASRNQRASIRTYRVPVIHYGSIELHMMPSQNLALVFLTCFPCVGLGSSILQVDAA